MLQLRESQTLHIRIEGDHLALKLVDHFTNVVVGFRIPIKDLEVRKDPMKLVVDRINTLQYHIKTFNYGFLYGMGGPIK